MIQTAKILSAVVLSLAAGGAMAQGLAGRTLPSSISFDGYCDTIEGLVNLGITYAGTYNACGVFSMPVGGATATLLAGMKGNGAALMAESYPYVGVGLTFNFSSKGTWIITNSAGEVLNSGTWTSGVAASRGTNQLLAR